MSNRHINDERGGNAAPPLTTSDTVRIADPNGLHFRAAGQLVKRLREEAPEAEVLLRRLSDGRRVDTASLRRRTLSFFGCVELGLRQGDEIMVEATGPDAENAVRIVREVLGTSWPEEEREDLQEWRNDPNGWLRELADDRALWVLLEADGEGEGF